MRHLSFAAAWALLLVGIACLSLSERTSAFWQSRDSNYNINVAAGGSTPFALDGSAQGSTVSSGSAASAAITTTHANDVIVAFTEVNGSSSGQTVTCSDNLGSHLTWTTRASAGNNINGFQIFECWAVWSSSGAITVTVTSNQTLSFGVVTALGISGAHTASPFDSNASIPDPSNLDPITFSTSNANDFIVASFRFVSTASPTQGSYFSGTGTPQGTSGLIVGANFQLTEATVVSATQSSQSANIGTGSGNSGGGIVDAVIKGP